MFHTSSSYRLFQQKRLMQHLLLCKAGDFALQRFTLLGTCREGSHQAGPAYQEKTFWDNTGIGPWSPEPQPSETEKRVLPRKQENILYHRKNQPLLWERAELATQMGTEMFLRLEAQVQFLPVVLASSSQVAGLCWLRSSRIRRNSSYNYICLKSLENKGRASST